MHTCRHCGSNLNESVIDLGHQPPSNAYLSKECLSVPEISYPLTVYVCTNCWLVQLPAHQKAEDLFTPEYAYFSSVSSSWCDHARRYSEQAIRSLSLNANSFVVEIGSNDGYLLRYFAAQGIPCLGIEPTSDTANRAISRGISTIKKFFTNALAKQLEKADLVVVNNVLAHVPDINDFLSGLKCVIKSTGFASIEFPHIYRLISDNQFDTIYHEHYSYLSLTTVCRMCDAVGLTVFDVDVLPTHGGSLRTWVSHKGVKDVNISVDNMLRMESEAGFQSLKAYANMQANAVLAKNSLLSFLIHSKENGINILAYGAAAKGNTLLNFAGIKPDLIACVFDKSPSKFGKFLPGSHIPIYPAEQLSSHDIDALLVLPWNILPEIQAELGSYELYTAIPNLSMASVKHSHTHS
jgi:hypothetical protein